MFPVLQLGTPSNEESRNDMFSQTPENLSASTQRKNKSREMVKAKRIKISNLRIKLSIEKKRNAP